MRALNLHKDVWATIEAKTTYRNGWDEILGYVSTLFDFMKNVEVLTAPTLVAECVPVEPKIEKKEDIFKIKEQCVLVIRGINSVYDNAPFQFTFFNQTDYMRMAMPSDYLNSLKKSETEFLNEEEQLHTFDRFLDSIEVNGLICSSLRNQVPKIIKQYTEALVMYNNGEFDTNKNVDAENTSFAYGWKDFRFPLNIFDKKED